MQLNGIHHITAMAGDPQTNLDFYVGILGLRLVKKTVNFDDPFTYHLYYGDNLGTPGTIITFFPWPGARKGKPGAGQVTRIAFQVAPGSIGYWRRRLEERGIDATNLKQRFGREYLGFFDPDGIALEIVEKDNFRKVEPWTNSDVSPQYALRGFDGVTLSFDGYQRTADLLNGTMGAKFTASDGNCFRHVLGEGSQAAQLDLVCQPGGFPGRGGVGVVHHIAWDTPSDQEQVEWREKLTRNGLNVSPVLDRNYFHSIYYREPGQILFEIATTPPGFGVDEPIEILGEKLMLPDWLEPQRASIEATLPPLQIPKLKA